MVGACVGPRINMVGECVGSKEGELNVDTMLGELLGVSEGNVDGVIDGDSDEGDIVSNDGDSDEGHTDGVGDGSWLDGDMEDGSGDGYKLGRLVSAGRAGQNEDGRDGEGQTPEKRRQVCWQSRLIVEI